jgi:hypothetical protein
MVTPKGSMSTEGEQLQVSVLPYRCSICAPLVTRQMSILFQSSSCDTLCTATVPQVSEIPEGLMNNPVYLVTNRIFWVARRFDNKFSPSVQSAPKLASFYPFLSPFSSLWIHRAIILRLFSFCVAPTEKLKCMGT